MAKTFQGKVTSDKRDKTITVTVTSRETHPLYGKQYSVNRKYTAHDESNDANEGDIVEITEVRPISKTKAFTLSRVVERSKGSIKLKAEVTGEEEVVADEEDK